MKNAINSSNSIFKNAIFSDMNLEVSNTIIMFNIAITKRHGHGRTSKQIIQAQRQSLMTSPHLQTNHSITWYWIKNCWTWSGLILQLLNQLKPGEAQQDIAGPDRAFID